ncbi:putative L10-interacting MYB domain-containing protein-like [Cocos nucifera]|uniref:Putative L10-interacting MYB domain-containing protein-like n=1 Tax=Cocos nucifera TaxID=13894 RepID=A0A8K0IPF6_COCNU|nr:putative L10-interacting MYB domain-containing protein-like [Cocos nucifera]
MLKVGSSCRRASNWTDPLDLLMLALMRQEDDQGNYQNANRSKWGWNPVLKVSIPGNEQIWEEVISVNKEYARIKDKPFPSYDDIDILISKNIATGRYADTSTLSEELSDNDISNDETYHMDIEFLSARKEQSS